MRKVVLLENLDKKGNKGEVIEVADGYAMNHLIPKKLAKVATAEAIKEIEKQKAQEEQKKAENMAEAKKVRDKIDGYKLIIEAKANEEGHLFGGIDEKTIASQLGKKGFTIEPSMVKLEKHLKEVGEYEVEIKFFEGVFAKIKVDIQAEK